MTPALERVALVAADWLESQLAGRPAPGDEPADVEVPEPIPTR